MKKCTFIDLFAGIGGTRIGFKNACESFDIDCDCVFTSEIKPYAVETYKNNFNEKKVFGDITQIEPENIPDFDFLLGGFPCQPFSSAGKRMGFYDTRGTLFFNIEKILKSKNPEGFLLENVEGLTNHDGGKTLKVMIENLEGLGYHVSWRVLDSINFGVPQSRKRTYIIGRKSKQVDLQNITFTKKVTFSEIQETNQPHLKTPFTEKLLSHYKEEDLYGKSIKDKRGGKDNIHSWDIEIKGEVNTFQKYLLNTLLKERRKKHWAEKKGIIWMDGMPLTLEEILTFIDLKGGNESYLFEQLEDLVSKGYLKFEHPKKQIVQDGVKKRVYDEQAPKGYNIVTGKLSFEINKIINPKGITPTIVATDANKLGVIDNGGIRQLTLREGLRLFGFPEWYNINTTHSKGFDLLGNTVVVPVIEEVSKILLS